MVNQGVSLYAVGDIHPDRPNPDEIFDKVRPVLKEADIMFGHCEGVIGKKSVIQPRPSAITLSSNGSRLCYGFQKCWI